MGTQILLHGRWSPWRVIGDATFVKNFVFSFSVAALKRVLEEHRTSASSLNLFMKMVVGVQTKKDERKKKKGFWKVAFFFLSSFFVFLSFICTCDFGPNLVVFFVILRI